MDNKRLTDRAGIHPVGSSLWKESFVMEHSKENFLNKAGYHLYISSPKDCGK